MQNGYYQATAGMVTQFNRLNVISNNLANVNTIGYKRNDVVIGDFARIFKETQDELPLKNHTKDGAKFEIISGERRYRASKMAGLKEIPAYVRLVNDQELLEMALVENIQREDLDAIEVALTYQRLLEEIGLTQEALSQRVGKERSTITNSIRLLKLNPDVQQAIRNGDISAGHGRAILSLENPEDQQALFKQIVNNRLSVRQAEEAAKHFKSPKEISISKEPKTLPNNLRRAEKTLADALALKVEIKSSAKGDKGKIVLNFDNEEELEKILSYFN